MKALCLSILVAATAVQAAPFDLSTTATAHTNSVQLGGTIRYHLYICNSGPVAVTNAVLINWVDPSCQIVQVLTGCEQVSVINNEIAAILPVLQPGVVWNSTIIVKPTIGGRVMNLAMATLHVPDADPENDVAQTFTDVTGGALLKVDEYSTGGLRINVGRAVASGCVVEMSTDLARWTPVLTNYGLPSFSFTAPTDQPAAFYRVREQ